MGFSRASLLVLIVFFIYKASESLLQPTLRLFIVQSVFLALSPPSNRSLASGAGLANGLHISLETENSNQGAAAKYLLAYRILLNLPAIFLTLYCGPWSDRVGRRLPMMLPSVGGVVACAILSFCLRPDWLSPLVTVLAGALVYGLFGKSAIITMACNSYLTDVSSEDRRTNALGYLLGVNFVGVFLGSLMVGLYQYLATIGPALSTVSICNGVVVFIVVFGIVESRLDSDQAKAAAMDDEKQSRCCTNCRLNFPIESLRYLIRKRSGRRRRHLILLFLSMLVNQLCKAGEQDVILLFVQHPPLSWTGSMYGFYLCLYYACMGLNLLLVLPALTRWLKPKDTTLIMTGILLKTVRLLMTAFSDGNTTLVYCGAVVGSSAGFIVSATKSLITKLAADEDEVGKTFAILSSMETLSNLLGPGIFNSLYGITVSVFPGFIFVIDACVHLCLICLHLRLHFELEDDAAEEKEEVEKDAGAAGLGFIEPVNSNTE